MSWRYLSFSGESRHNSTLEVPFLRIFVPILIPQEEAVNAGNIRMSAGFRLKARGRSIAGQPLTFPSMEITATRRGMSFPLAATAASAERWMPPQQGTSIRATVTLRMSFWARMAESFSV